jgi:hypothetical protein
VTTKRIHELAKEWSVQPKDVIAAADQLGLKGKRSQSAVTDDEVQRLKQALGLAPRAPQVTVGAERVVAERVVTQRENGVERLVTAREQTTETRLQANVIRRRTAREVLKREELPNVPDGDVGAVPPSLDFDAAIPPPLDVPPPLDLPSPPPAAPVVEAPPPRAAEPAAAVPASAPAPVREAAPAAAPVTRRAACARAPRGSSWRGSRSPSRPRRD